jgi:reversibly glycosylated polypeptide/UDP-arabinopyranose mutase
MAIAVVVPTFRSSQINAFLRDWNGLFAKHEASVIVVRDDSDEGDIVLNGSKVSDEKSVLGECVGVVSRKSPACRCLGFAYIAKHMPEVDYIVTLDDDTAPDGDTIADHVSALSMRVPVSWLSSVTKGPHMRGFPYGIRSEAPVYVSHGVWKNIPDLDAPTQLVLGNTPEVEFYRGPVPRGVHFPFCGMNVGFRREAIPMMLWSPAKEIAGAERFDDIWLGVRLTQDLSSAGAAMVSGYSSCVHTRLSDVFKNLIAEAKGISINEKYWAGDCCGEASLVDYDSKRAAWKKLTGGSR